MSANKIIDDVYWVGAVDWNMQSFHGHTYSTRRGTTYNAYLIVDEKIALIDTVHAPFTGELINNIQQVIDPARIDYIIANHVETDHSGALPELLKRCSGAKVFGTARCKEGLYKHYYCDMDFQVVKTGEKLSLGKKTLSFIEAPMIHWPDSMFTYLQEDALLLPNDAFGQHIASSARFDDEVDPCALMQEAAKYYANILWPLGQLIDNKIKELLDMNIPIRMIAPSHGIIWRKDPGRIISAYQSWAQNTVRRKAVVLFETMWGSTEKMARRIVEGITDSAVEVKLFDIAKSDPSDVVTEMLDAQGFVAGSSTYDNDMLPKIAGFLEYLKGAKPRKRIGAAFGSFGWGGGAVKEIESVFKEAGIDTVQSPLSVKYVPSTEELENCYAFG